MESQVVIILATLLPTMLMLVLILLCWLRWGQVRRRDSARRLDSVVSSGLGLPPAPRMQASSERATSPRESGEQQLEPHTKASTSSPEMPEKPGTESTGASYDCFLAHDWGSDELGRDNHERVRLVNAGLVRAGFSTWFDDERIRGNINAELADASARAHASLACSIYLLPSAPILSHLLPSAPVLSSSASGLSSHTTRALLQSVDASKTVLVFVTARYIDKVAGKGERGANDNCKYEFARTCIHANTHTHTRAHTHTNGPTHSGAATAHK